MGWQIHKVKSSIIVLNVTQRKFPKTPGQETEVVPIDSWAWQAFLMDTSDAMDEKNNYKFFFFVLNNNINLFFIQMSK